LAHFENQGEPIEVSRRVTDCAPEKRQLCSCGNDRYVYVVDRELRRVGWKPYAWFIGMRLRIRRIRTAEGSWGRKVRI
jgi:hypothetical protein